MVSRSKKKALRFILVKRGVFFFFSLCGLSFFLYGIGTAQAFMDATQLFLLRLSLVTGFLLAAAAAAGFVLALWNRIVLKGRGLCAAVLYLFFCCLGLAAAALSSFITAVAGGNV
jgi:nitrate/nitrite transporter NarK